MKTCMSGSLPDTLYLVPRMLSKQASNKPVVQAVRHCGWSRASTTTVSCLVSSPVFTNTKSQLASFRLKADNPQTDLSVASRPNVNGKLTAVSSNRTKQKQHQKKPQSCAVLCTLKFRIHLGITKSCMPLFLSQPD